MIRPGTSTLLGLFGIASSSDGSPGNTPITNLIGKPGALTERMLFTSSSQPDNYWIDTYVPNSYGKIAFIRTQQLEMLQFKIPAAYGQKNILFRLCIRQVK